MSPATTTIRNLVEALLAVLPTPTRLQATPCSGGALAGRLGAGVVASFVGVTSADLAIVLTDPHSLDAAAGNGAFFEPRRPAACPRQRRDGARHRRARRLPPRRRHGPVRGCRHERFRARERGRRERLVRDPPS
ncbi:hypothetical protein [Cryobacterium breve]|uniref:hypothetical protein n=1 Tax=Cryobacterium breve TaxID=1259258 RepID=UPI00248C840E|nr:hypothetical protein [Cryobacterium breve]